MLCTCQDWSSLITDKLIAYQRHIPVCTCPATFLFMNLAGYNYIYIYNSRSVATVAADLEHCDQCDSCMAIALTTGVISVFITASSPSGSHICGGPFYCIPVCL